MSVRGWLRVAFAFALLAVVYGAPIWEELFGLPPPEPQYYNNDYGYNYNRGHRQPKNRESRAQSGNEKYKATCRVINPDNYAFPGQIPYPSAPLCPY